MQISLLHEAARHYAALGWKIFPIAPGHKGLQLTQNAIYDASSNLAQVDAWWSETPNANIGLYCVGSGLHVLDIDTKFGPHVLPFLHHLQGTQGRLPPAPISRTRSGGFHALFDARGAPSDWSEKADPLYDRAWQLPGADGNLKRVIEVKVAGYILLPPSYIEGATEKDGIGGPYVWMRHPHGPAPMLPPGWYRGLRRPAPIMPRDLPPATGPCPAKLQGLVDHVASQASGNRDAALWWASNRALEEVSAGYYRAGEAYARLYEAGLMIGQNHSDVRRALRKLRPLAGVR